MSGGICWGVCIVVRGCGFREPERLRWFGWGSGDYQVWRRETEVLGKCFGKTSQSELTAPSCSLSKTPLSSHFLETHSSPRLKPTLLSPGRRRNLLKIPSRAKFSYKLAQRHLDWSSQLSLCYISQFHLLPIQLQSSLHNIILFPYTVVVVQPRDFLKPDRGDL